MNQSTTTAFHSLLQKNFIESAPYENILPEGGHPKSQERLKNRRRLIMNADTSAQQHSELGQRVRLQDRKINVIIDVPKDEKFAHTYK